MLQFWTADDIKNFAIESNVIERDMNLTAPLVMATSEVCFGIEDLAHLLDIHKRITAHLNVRWSGKWRTIDVRVGNHKPISYMAVPDMMAQFWDNIQVYTSWEAHNKFETIHPFVDFNGRMGRLIWLSKAVKEGYKFNISFLQKYYYQTLEYIQKEKLDVNTEVKTASKSR